VGGNILAWLGIEQEQRSITITQWSAGAKVALGWKIVRQVETAESVAAREAYTRTYASSAVGVEIPEPPDPSYEDEVIEGSIGSESLASANTLGLPDSWPEGDGGYWTTSLLWLSRSHYDELVHTRSTVVSLGLFDESLMRVENATGRLTMMIDKLSGLLDPLLGESAIVRETQEDTQSLLTWKADPTWGEYTLLVDGIQTRVRVVNAKNAFASYTVLANADNPLILEIQLTPLSQGNLNLLNSEGFVEGFGGYEVTDINTSGV
jgi:hypothetical protein